MPDTEDEGIGADAPEDDVLFADDASPVDFDPVCPGCGRPLSVSDEGVIVWTRVPVKLVSRDENG